MRVASPDCQGSPEQGGDPIDRCRARLATLATLPKGWHDGTGEALTPAALAAASALLERNPSLAGLYRIFPTDAGGFLFEFVRDAWSYTTEIDPGVRAEIYGVEIAGRGEIGPTSLA